MNDIKVLPLLPLRDIVVFPYMVVPLFVGRDKSIAALDKAMAGDRLLVLSAQKQAKTNNPEAEDLFEIGTLGAVIQLLRLPDGTIKMLVEGKGRARIHRFVQETPFFMVEAEQLDEKWERTTEGEALMRAVHQAFENYVKLSKKVPPEVLMSVASIDDPARLADSLVAHLSLKLVDKQLLLETVDPVRRLEKLLELIQSEMDILIVERKIKNRVRKQMEKSQRDYYLNEQMQAIQKELGDKDDFRNEMAELEEAATKKKLPKEARERLDKELRKLKMMAPMSAEATVVRNYVDWVIALPWMEYSQDRLDISEAENILDEDHYGLERAKERILEYLAVQSLSTSLKGPILCLVGPPGVGKTSLARSVARATGREYVRISLGGVRDEAEIRGHRRTYIGALGGKIIQSLRKVRTSNPVFLLDEVDKMTADFRGDPSSALLEVLDPEQNHTFMDHYLDLDYDLSRVMFITTANYRDGIPIPLQDRMEIIELTGYTEFDKLQIAQNFLVRKEKKANGLEDVDISFSDDAVTTIIRHYTREAGVRSLEREVASIFRKIAKEYIKKGKPADASFRVSPQRVTRYLGPLRFTYGKTERKDTVGAVTGLSVTSTGGDLLTVEASVVPSADQTSGKLIITGLVKKVMEESGHAALTYVRSRSEALGIPAEVFARVDVHVHIPEGAIPKDGPSAGITMATAITSALTHFPVWGDVAMTGEITLRGRVLPIGGIKEKLIAAHRGGIRKVLLPKENEKDLRDVPQAVRKGLELVLVDHMDEVLAHALKVDKGELFRPEPPAAPPPARGRTRGEQAVVRARNTN
ncbi:MAG: endopeptidase La [Deltaproteobacteria bacterium]|nr:endopeptidase La [Deltaproteobacteria bacterium]